jgi:chromosome segregation ATPase
MYENPSVKTVNHVNQSRQTQIRKDKAIISPSVVDTDIFNLNAMIQQTSNEIFAVAAKIDAIEKQIEPYLEDDSEYNTMKSSWIKRKETLIKEKETLIKEKETLIKEKESLREEKELLLIKEADIRKEKAALRAQLRTREDALYRIKNKQDSRLAGESVSFRISFVCIILLILILISLFVRIITN